MIARRLHLGHIALRQLLASCLLWHATLAHAQRAESAPAATRAPTNGLVAISAATNVALTVYVDGNAIGPAPRLVSLAPGIHEITASGVGIEVYPVQVRVEPQKTISIGLTVVPEPARFEIDPVAADAVLFVDGKTFGVGKREIRLTPGRHHLELRREGHQTQRLSLDVQPGQKAQLRAAPYVTLSTTRHTMPVSAPSSQRQQNVAPPGAMSSPPRAGQNAPAVASPSGNVQPTAPPSPAPLPAPDASAQSSPYRGIFGSFIVPIMLGGKSTHSYLNDCPAKAFEGACTATAPRGGGVALRLGYFYEWVGLELIGGGALDVSTTELKLPPIPAISSTMQNAAGRNVFVRAGGMYGLGLRLAIPMQGIRITVGADYLFLHRKVYAIPDSFAGTSLSYKVPGWFIDGGIQLGSTPGARFYLGAFALIEQAHDLPLTRNLAALGIDPSVVPEALTKMVVYQGRQVFFGPLLGIAFGH